MSEEKEMPTGRKRLEELRRMWKEAVADNGPGVSPTEVFTRLLRKYEEKAS